MRWLLLLHYDYDHDVRVRITEAGNSSTNWCNLQVFQLRPYPVDLLTTFGWRTTSRTFVAGTFLFKIRIPWGVTPCRLVNIFTEVSHDRSAFKLGVKHSHLNWLDPWTWWWRHHVPWKRRWLFKQSDFIHSYDDDNNNNNNNNNKENTSSITTNDIYYIYGKFSCNIFRPKWAFLQHQTIQFIQSPQPTQISQLYRLFISKTVIYKTNNEYTTTTSRKI
jgi:hypothetical protein